MRKSYHSTSGNSSYKIWLASWIEFGIVLLAMFLLGLAVGLAF